jgi:hypothetical protein
MKEINTKKRIQFITCDRVKDTYGVTSGLFNSASFVVNYLNENDFETKITPVVDSNQIDRVVSEFNPDIVIIEAIWVPPAKFKELFQIQRHKNRRWIVRLHSKAPFLANEGIATRWIKQYASIRDLKIEIAPNTTELTEQLTYCFPSGKFIFLPNIYKAKTFTPEKHVKSDDFIDIGSFGAIRPMKNTYQQAMAAIEFAEQINKTLRFHINGTRIEQSGDNVLKNIQALFEHSEHELIEHKWYKHDEFLEIASKMDIGMQVSFSESFNIVTADFVTAKVPIVASDDISWMPWIMKVSPTSHKGIVRKLKLAYKYRGSITWLQSFSLNIYNIKAKLQWLFKIKN